MSNLNSVLIFGKKYDMHNADDRKEILDLIDENRDNAAINSQTMVALILFGVIERIVT